MLNNGQIFLAERYNTLLKDIKKLRLEQKAERDKTAKDVGHYRDQAAQAEKKGKELKTHEKRLEQYSESLQKYKDEMDQLQEKIRDKDDILRNYSGIHQKYTEANTSIKNNEKQIQELRESLRDKVIDDIDQVESEQESLDNESQSLESERKKIENEKTMIENQLEREKKIAEKVREKVAEGRAHEETHKKNEKQVQELVKEICDNLEWDVPNDVSKKFIDEVVENLDASLEHFQQERKQKETEFQEKISTNESEKKDLEIEKGQLDAKKKLTSDNRGKKSRDIALIKKRLAELKGSSEKLASLSSKLEQKDREITNAQNNIDVNALEDEIEDKSQKVKSLNDSVKDLRQELTKLSKQRDIYAQISMKEKELKEKKEKIKKLQNKNGDALDTLFEGSIPKLDVLKKSFDKIFREKQSQKDVLDEQKLKLDTSSKHEQLSLNKLLDQTKSDEMRIKNFEHKLGSLNSIDSFDEDLKSAKASVEKIREELQAKESNKHSFPQLIEKLEKFKRCPTCKRGFDKDEDCDEVIEFLREEIANVPSKVKFITSR